MSYYQSVKEETKLLQRIANGCIEFGETIVILNSIFPPTDSIDWTQEDVEELLSKIYGLRPPEIDRIMMTLGYSTYLEHLNPPLSKLIPSIMNDFDAETNVDNAMHDMIESRKEENYLNQEDNNILHDLLSDLRHFKEKLFLEGNLPGQMEIGSSGSFEILWTEEEKNMFARFNVHSLNQSKEAKQ